VRGVSLPAVLYADEIQNSPISCWWWRRKLLVKALSQLSHKKSSQSSKHL